MRLLGIAAGMGLTLALVAACAPPGAGDGWVTGSLWVEHCKSGRALGPTDDFDLRVGFFSGDPLFDTTDSTVEQRSRLTLRVQETSNNIEEANGFVMQFQDLVQAAQAFVDGRPIPFSDDSLCPGCTDINASLRMRLNLFVSCPDNRASLTAGSFPLESRETAGTARQIECLLPVADSTPTACPDRLGEGERAQLEAICSGDFNDRSHSEVIERILGSAGSCLYLCELGSLRRGEDPAGLFGFEIDYGDPIAAIFSTDIVDSRALRLNRCAGAMGRLNGMFRFDLVRSRVAQPFP